VNVFRQPTFSVSVVIPVFNAADYLEKAVDSALQQPQVTEVILVEDGSTDESLSICSALSKKHRRVQLLQHPGGQSRGAGASRNLGILNAAEEFVSFLDADDFMLEQRFAKTREVFDAHPDADGVYEAVGTFFQTERVKAQWLERGSPLVTTVLGGIRPDRFFHEQGPIGKSGCIHTNGWTVKRQVFKRSGLFNESLPLHQDTDLFIRFAIAGKMYPGEIVAPVAMRRVHENNRITQERTPDEAFVHRIRMWCAAFSWARENRYGPQSDIILARLARSCFAAGVYGDERWRPTAIWKRQKQAREICPALSVRTLYFGVFTHAFSSLKRKMDIG